MINLLKISILLWAAKGDELDQITIDLLETVCGQPAPKLQAYNYNALVNEVTALRFELFDTLKKQMNLGMEIKFELELKELGSELLMPKPPG